jgi:hypothetical protein
MEFAPLSRYSMLPGAKRRFVLILSHIHHTINVTTVIIATRIQKIQKSDETFMCPLLESEKSALKNWLPKTLCLMSVWWVCVQDRRLTATAVPGRKFGNEPKQINVMFQLLFSHFMKKAPWIQLRFCCPEAGWWTSKDLWYASQLASFPIFLYRKCSQESKYFNALLIALTSWMSLPWTSSVSRVPKESDTLNPFFEKFSGKGEALEYIPWSN